MTTTVSGSYPAVNSDSDATINGLTVGKGGGNFATNTAFGFETLKANTTGEENVAVGYRALDANTTGTNSIAIGRNALGSNTTGSSNVAIGDSALVSNTTASSNAAFGSDALNANTTGANNVAVGRSALQSNTTASNNTAVGYRAGYSNTTGTPNTFVGADSGYAVTTGVFNTILGYRAGYSLTTGSGNTFIGGGATDVYTSGYFITTGNKNSILGNYSGNQGGLDIRTASNYIVLSDGDGNPRLQIDGSGTLNVPGANAPSMFGVYNNTTGSAANVHVLSSGALIRSTSSIKYKTDVQDATHGLAEVMQLRPVTYKGINDGDLVFGGLIAEEVDAAGLTEFVQYADDGTPDALAYGNMVSLCVKAIQELKAEFDAYKATHP